jgi:hypothetical protein
MPDDGVSDEERRAFLEEEERRSTLEGEMLRRTLYKPMTDDEKRWHRHQAELKVIIDAFNGEGHPNFQHALFLLFRAMKKQLGRQFVTVAYAKLKERYGEAALARMIPEIEEISGDDDARRIFGLWAPLSPSEREKMVKNAFLDRLNRMSEPNISQAVREKLEENRNLPPELQEGIGGVEQHALDTLIRRLLRARRKASLKVVK